MATVAIVATSFVAGPVADPSPAGAAVSTNTDADYATLAWSDPWDFSNAEDFGHGGAMNLASWNITGGRLDATVNSGGGLILAEGISGVIPAGRNTRLALINANRFRKLSFRMWSEDSRPGGFFWYTCDHIIPSCENGFAFTVHSGWNNYVFDIAGMPTFRGAPAWGGSIHGLRLAPAGGGSDSNRIGLDWVRLVESAASDTPPSPPVPLPVVDSPSLAGGLDYASLVRRDAWDMSQPSDVAAPGNMSYGFTGVMLNGINAGSNMGDAHFSLPLTWPIDANRFHRLTFNVFYEGPHGLGFGPGGGMVARLIWETAGARGVWQDSEDIIVYPGWNNVSLDLSTYPSWAITDPDRPNRIGWAGQTITSVRFDPHEDIGARRFLVDNIRIAEDSTGYGGAFDIKFHDNAHRAGTVADIYVTNTRGGFGGTRIASGIPVAQGINTFRWRPNPLPAGHVWPYVVLRRDGNTARAYSTGPLRMTASPSPIYGIDPFGSFDSARQGPTGVRVRGWAIDPDTTAPIPVHFWVDGRAPVGAVTADVPRGDIDQAFPEYGADHGFNGEVKVPPGVHSLCAFAINTGPGTTRQLGCKTVNVAVNPFGSLDVVRTRSNDVRVSGWAIDPNTAGPITVHLYVQNGAVYTARANRDRPDLGTRYAAYGTEHGFARTFPRTKAQHTVCAYGINRGPGGNALIGCKTG
jgi:hypothetical protein